MISILLFACSTQNLVQGTLQDIWNKPIEGAQVQMQDVDKPTTTTSSGNFSFIAKQETMRFRATKDGYIPSVGQTDYKAGESPSVQLSMYPTVEKNGFWLIDQEGYTALSSSPIKKKESKAQKLLGVFDVGTVKTSKPKPSFVFRTTLRKEQLQQLDLEVHSMKFINKTTFNALTGPQEVDIDLWVPDKQVAFSIKDLGADDHFLIEFSEPLARGVYIFHSHDILDPKSDVGASDIPKELLTSFPFEIK